MRVGDKERAREIRRDSIGNRGWKREIARDKGARRNGETKGGSVLVIYQINRIDYSASLSNWAIIELDRSLC